MVDQARDRPRPSADAFADALPAALLAQLDNYAPDAYDARSVARGIDHLRAAGVFARVARPDCSPEGHGADRDAAEAAYRRQLAVLYAVGRGSLPLGRVFEGHVNALELVHRFGDGEQREHFGAAAAAGAVFGVWNTEIPREGVHVRPHAEGGYVLEGAKTFCSGADVLDYAIVPGQRWGADGRAAGWQMCIVAMGPLGPERHDGSFWSPLGMEASASHRVDFTGVRLSADALLGEPNDYHGQPHFSGGAVRFAAVQLGGAHALHDHALALLKAMHRERDPYQAHRVGRMAIALQSGRNWLYRAAGEALCPHGDPAGVVDFANMTRTAVLEACNRVLDEAEMAVGARGMLSPKPIQRVYCDLKMYLRQPAPDSALAAVGHHAAERHTMPAEGSATTADLAAPSALAA